MATHLATVVVVIALYAGGLLAARMKEKPVNKDNLNFCPRFVPDKINIGNAFWDKGTNGTVFSGNEDMQRN